MPIKNEGESKQDEGFKWAKKAKSLTKKAKSVTKKAKSVTKKAVDKTKSVTKKAVKSAKKKTKGIGGMIKNAVRKVTKKITDAFMKPINALKIAILGPIRNIEDFIRTVLCLAVYLKLVFEWCSKTVVLITKYFLAAPFCFMFWIMDSFMRFCQYIIIDVMLNIVLQPAIFIGKALSYPFVDDIKITGDNRKSLYENTNPVRWIIKGIDGSVNLPFKIYDKCFDIGGIEPFPKYYS